MEDLTTKSSRPAVGGENDSPWQWCCTAAARPASGRGGCWWRPLWCRRCLMSQFDGSESIKGWEGLHESSAAWSDGDSRDATNTTGRREAAEFGAGWLSSDPVTKRANVTVSKVKKVPAFISCIIRLFSKIKEMLHFHRKRSTFHQPGLIELNCLDLWSKAIILYHCRFATAAI